MTRRPITIVPLGRASVLTQDLIGDLYVEVNIMDSLFPPQG